MRDPTFSGAPDMAPESTKTAGKGDPGCNTLETYILETSKFILQYSSTIGWMTLITEMVSYSASNDVASLF